MFRNKFAKALALTTALWSSSLFAQTPTFSPTTIGPDAAIIFPDCVGAPTPACEPKKSWIRSLFGVIGAVMGSNGVLYAADFTGADFGAKLNSACGALPASGGVVDARGFTGAQSFAATINCGSDTQPVTILLPSGVLITGASGAQFLYYSSMHISGAGPGYTPANNTHVVCQGAVSCLAYGGSGQASGNPVWPIIENVVFSDATTSSIACDFTNLYRAMVTNVGCSGDSKGLKIGGNGNGAYYNVFSNIYTDANGIGLDVEGFANQNQFYGGTFNDNNVGTSLFLGGTADSFYSPDFENDAHPIEFGSGGANNAIVNPYFEADGPIVFDIGTVGNSMTGTGGLVPTITDNSGNYTNYWLFTNSAAGQVGLFPNVTSVVQTYLFGSGSGYGVNNSVGFNLQPGDSTFPVSLFYFGGASDVYGRWGYAPLQVGRLVSFGGQALLGLTTKQGLASPTAPTITQHGATGATAATYYIVCIDGNGGRTAPSAAGSTSTGNASLSGTNYNIVTWPAEIGCIAYDVLKADTAHSVSTFNAAVVASPPAMTGGAYGASVMTFNDTGYASVSYSASVNTTGDIVDLSLPTSCTGRASGTIWNSSGTLHVC